MIAFLLANWKVCLGAAGAFLIALGLHNLDVNRIQARAAKELTAQVQADIKLCDSDKAKTTKAETYYETQIVALNSELNKLRKRPSTCIPITRPASGSNATDKPSKSGDGNGAVTSGALLDFAGECEIDRIKVITLQGFILEERK